ncbi:MAG: polyhydroxyalkanoate synthesis repressor PhaR [Gammaproteobacteria bacterium]|jgi:polyhydroxyalkanoate synthesis repressor PhaR|nr:polyhydroxyalkanoate synthesis repressor PhaR [Gammaproteobacteria bacterium]
MNKPRIIKKYPNRRLYDTEESRYITLADIRSLVMHKVDFMVIDKKSQEDITRNILLQVISEQEQLGDPIMSREFLAHVIRSYGDTMQSMVGSYLEQSLKLFMDQQQQVRDRIKSVVGIDPVGMVTGVAQKNYQRWKTVQEDLLRTFGGTSSHPEAQAEPPKATPKTTPQARKKAKGSHKAK